jgi:hypothetical protein
VQQGKFDAWIVGVQASAAVKMPTVDVADRNDDQDSNTALVSLRGYCRHTDCHRQLSAAVVTVPGVAAFLLEWLCRNPQGEKRSFKGNRIPFVLNLSTNHFAVCPVREEAEHPLKSICIHKCT